MRLLALGAIFLALPALAETRSYDIKGMTCGSCVKMIDAQVCKLPNLESCKVEIGKVTVTAPTLDDEVIKAAVAKAGEYSVVGIEHADAAAGSAIKPNPGPTLKTEKSKTNK